MANSTINASDLLVNQGPFSPKTNSAEQLITVIMKNLDLCSNMKRDIKDAIKKDLGQLKNAFRKQQQQLDAAKTQSPQAVLNLSEIMQQFNLLNAKLDQIDDNQRDFASRNAATEPQVELVEAFSNINNKLDNLNQNHKSYANVTATNSRTTSNNKQLQNKFLPNKKHLLIIKPKQMVSNKQTEAELKSSINCISKKVAIKQLKNAQNGAILLECVNEADRDIIHDHISNLANTEVESSKPRSRNPRLILHNVAPEIAEEDLIEMLIAQNEALKDELELHPQEDAADHLCLKFKLRKSNKSADSRNSFVVETSPKIRTIMMQNDSKLLLPYHVVAVRDYIYIKRCFKCSGFNHSHDNCKVQEVICPKCAGDHKLADCAAQDKEHKCINCINHNKKFPNEFSIKHSSLDPNCKSYIKIKQLLQSKIDYE